LIKLARMLLNGGKSAEGLPVISEASVEIMHRPQVKLPTRAVADEWCLGPFLRRWSNYLVFGHSGTNLSGSSTLLWCPQKNVAIAAVVNVPDQGYPLADAIFDVVFPEVFGIDKPGATTPANATRVETDVRPYAGRFEAFGMTYTFALDGSELTLTSNTVHTPELNVTGSKLIPMGDGRFLPCDLRVSGNRNWDIAFWGSDANGRPTHLLQGVFPLRRTG